MAKRMRLSMYCLAASAAATTSTVEAFTFPTSSQRAFMGSQARVRTTALSTEKLMADPIDPRHQHDNEYHDETDPVMDIAKESITASFGEQTQLGGAKDSEKEMLLQAISSTSPTDILSEIESDIADHVQSIFSEDITNDITKDIAKELSQSSSPVTSNNNGQTDAMNEDVRAVLEISGEAAAAAEASMPQDLKNQLEFGTNATTEGLVEVDSVPEILSAASVVGEPATTTKIESPSAAKILKFAIPAIGVWLCGPLLSLIDTSAVGVLSGTIQQAALNPAVAVTDYAALLIAFMYTGTTNLVAAAQESDRGTPDKPVTTKTLIGAMRLSTFVGAGLGAFLFAFARPLLKAIIGNDAISPAVFAAAMKYVRIRALGMPAAAIIGSTQAACLGMQDIRSPLYVLVAAAVVNFFGDIFFVSNSHPLIGGAAGAAWATVISQYTGVLLFVRWLCNKPKPAPKVMNLSKAILQVTGKDKSDGGSRSMQLKESLQNFKVAKNEEKSSAGKLFRRVFPRKKPATNAAGKETSFSVRGFLENKFSAIDLVKPPSAETRKEFAPYLVPVTTTQVGRVSGYVAMSHVVASSLGTVAMAAQQVIVSLFYCLTPIADSLSLTAQSFLPTISERKASPEKAAALRKTALNFAKAGVAFGGGMMAAVAAIPLLSGFFTSDPVVISMVNSVVPHLLAFFGVHGVLCAAEGVLLGQKDLNFLGKMYAAYFAVVPYMMMRVKRAALAGTANVGLTSVWKVFLGYQMFRFGAWVVRVLELQRRTNREADLSSEFA